MKIITNELQLYIARGICMVNKENLINVYAAIYSN